MGVEFNVISDVKRLGKSEFHSGNIGRYNLAIWSWSFCRKAANLLWIVIGQT